MADNRSDLEQAVERARAAGSPLDLSTALRDLAEHERHAAATHAAARCHYEESVALLRRLAEASPLRLAHTVRHLGDLYREAGQPAPAEACYDEALAIYRSHTDGRPLDLANALRGAALLKEDQGQTPAARRHWQEARDLYTALGIAPGTAEADRRLAALDRPA